MSLYDFINNKSVPDGWVEVDSAFACPECDAVSEDCYYNSEEGTVIVLCEQGHDEKIFIGRGL